METFIATCPYCGQAQTVTAESKVEAEDKIIALCMCDEAKFETRKRSLRRQVKKLCQNAENEAFKALADNTTLIVKVVAEAVISHTIESAQIQTGDSTINLKRNADGIVLLSRKCTVEEGADA